MIKLLDLLKEDNFFGLKVGDTVKFKDSGDRSIAKVKYNANPNTEFKITTLYPGHPEVPNPNTHADLKDEYGKEVKKVYTGYLKKVMGEKLDPVGKEDSDPDNDGIPNTDSDKYILKRRKAIAKNLKEGDHEVAMAQSSLKDIAKAAIELAQKMGGVERNIPGWIQNHITNAENYIEQAAQGFHELKDESLNENQGIEYDIEQDLMQGEFENPEAQIEYLQGIIDFCNNKIAELQANG